MENCRCGIVEPDEIDHARILEIARPYLGEVVGAYSDWTPLQDRGACCSSRLWTRAIHGNSEISGSADTAASGRNDFRPEAVRIRTVNLLPAPLGSLGVLGKWLSKLHSITISDRTQQRSNSRGFIFTYEAVLDWDAKLASALTENLRCKREGLVGRRCISTKHTSECVANGGIWTARSITTARWHVERAPRFGCRQSILSIRQDGDWRHVGPCHDR
jgi:hypothetical protein